MLGLQEDILDSGRSSRRNIPLLRHLGAGGTVYLWPLRTSLSDHWDLKDACPDLPDSTSLYLLLLVWWSAPPTSWGGSSWQAHHSSHCSQSFIDGSGGKPHLSLAPWLVMVQSPRNAPTPALGWCRGPRLPSFMSPPVASPSW